MLSGDQAFERYELHALSTHEMRNAEVVLSLPYLEAFVGSIDLLQATANNGTVRSYQKVLLRQGWFELTSPRSGERLRSGCSLVLADKAMVFSFPDEPELLLGIGDISRAYPICVALLTDRQILLGLFPNDWGFSERHIPRLAEVIKATGWKPDWPVGMLHLVTGDANYAHHAWNQISALEELVRAGVPSSVRLVATQQPLGPIKEIFPELAHWDLVVTPDSGLEAMNGPGLLFAPIGGNFINHEVLSRILKYGECNISNKCEAIRTALREACEPVLWMSVRTQNRTATNQVAMLAALGLSFMQVAPRGSIVIDGFSVTADFDDMPSYHQDTARQAVAADAAVAEELRQALVRVLPPSRIHVAVGLRVTDSILLGREANLYFCHHGSVQHKIGWFSAIPGVVHSNSSVLALKPSIYVADQSEVAVPPLYLPADLVEDIRVDPDSRGEFDYLLLHDAYIFSDIPRTIEVVLSHASQSGLVLSLKGRILPACTHSLMDTVKHVTKSVVIRLRGMS